MEETPNDFYKVPKITRIFLENKKKKEQQSAKIVKSSLPRPGKQATNPRNAPCTEYNPVKRPLDSFFPVIPKGTSSIFPGATRGRGGWFYFNSERQNIGRRNKDGVAKVNDNVDYFTVRERINIVDNHNNVINNINSNTSEIKHIQAKKLNQQQQKKSENRTENSDKKTDRVCYPIKHIETNITNGHQYAIDHKSPYADGITHTQATNEKNEKKRK